MMRGNRFKTALVLSGGGARALCHLGALEQLIAHRVEIDLIVGTSMGAVIGGLYACYGNLSPVTKRMKAFLQSDLFHKTMSQAIEDLREDGSEHLLDRFLSLLRKGIYYSHSLVRNTIVPAETYLEVMSHLIPSCSIEELPLPFAAVAMDLENGEEVVITKGSLREAVSASVAIPGILPSVNTEDRFLVDGGWVDNVPVAPAIALGGHFVVSVDASPQPNELGPIPTSALDLLHRSNDLSRLFLSRQRRACTDVLLEPKLGQMYWADFTKVDRCISEGRNIVQTNMQIIRRKKMLRRIACLGGWIHPARSSTWRRPMVII